MYDQLYDSRVPEALKTTQQWFGGVIGRSLDDKGHIQSKAPSGRRIVDEAADFIKPSPTLKPAQRMQIYNQQFWWRLLSILHEIYPLVVRLFGYYEFNQRLGIPYLLRFPPTHWSLNELGARFFHFTQEIYRDKDQELVLQAIAVDAAFSESFLVAEFPAISMENLPIPNDPGSLFEKTLFLQNHVYLFEMDHDLFTLREEFLKQPVEHWQENEFPPLKKEKRYHFVLYRNSNNLIQWNAVSAGEWGLLGQFRKGASIETACAWLEGQNETIQEEASQQLPHWFQGWIVKRWLTLEQIFKIQSP